MRKKDADKSVENLTDRILSYISHEVRSQGTCYVAAQAGISRQALYRALVPGANPQIKTVLVVLSVLGLQLGLRPIPKKRRKK